jgi:DNA-binding response OmpR family regulator
MRLLAVEDDVALATALRRGLAHQGMAVDLAHAAGEARSLLRINPYDVVVLDLGLPDDDGLNLLAEMRARAHPAPVLVLTARGTIADRVAGLDAGADDYLLKPFAFSELVARIRALRRRTSPAVPIVLRIADLELHPSRLQASRGGTPLVLTAKEFSILAYLMHHAGTLVTRTMLLDHCWDESYDGVSNLVDVHVSRVRRKLEAAGGPPLLHTVRGAGFILEERSR